jgi:protein-tyrosine-phosphatase
MNVLFVCKANVGRSQVAQALFEELSHHNATSAGSEADRILAEDPSAGKQLKDGRARYSIPYMQERGLNIGERERTQLTPELVDQADKVIVILPKEDWPEYLVESEKIILWDLPDPIDTTHDGAWRIFDEIGVRIRILAKEIG